MSNCTDNNKYESQKGLTLVEIMVGLVIIGISVLSMYIMFINGRELIMEQYHRKLALERARAVMEDMSYTQKQLGVVPISFRGTLADTLVATSDDHVGIMAERHVTVDYSPVSNPKTGLPYYSEVSVVYEWEELSGRPYRIELRGAF